MLFDKLKDVEIPEDGTKFTVLGYNVSDLVDECRLMKETNGRCHTPNIDSFIGD